METIEEALKDPKKSDQRRGEQTVQVNDSYESSKESVDDDHVEDDQHQHGGCGQPTASRVTRRRPPDVSSVTLGRSRPFRAVEGI